MLDWGLRVLISRRFEVIGRLTYCCDYHTPTRHRHSGYSGIHKPHTSLKVLLTKPTVYCGSIERFTMDDPDSTYAPQSPDLSAYHSSYAAPEQHTPSSYYPQHPQSPYQPQHYLQYHHQQQQSAYNLNDQIPQHPQYQQHPSAMPIKNGRMKDEHEDGDWAPEAGSSSSTGRGRKSKKMKLGQEDYGAGGKLAPGVAEGIEVKTKFPVARIKRIMQADEDVGKVAQVTPTAVCELFSSDRPW